MLDNSFVGRRGFTDGNRLVTVCVARRFPRGQESFCDRQPERTSWSSFARPKRDQAPSSFEAVSRRCISLWMRSIWSGSNAVPGCIPNTSRSSVPGYLAEFRKAIGRGRTGDFVNSILEVADISEHAAAKVLPNRRL